MNITHLQQKIENNKGDIEKKQLRVLYIEEHLEILENTNTSNKPVLDETIKYWKKELNKLEVAIREYLSKGENI